ncbi:MAG: hypothetical protein CL525_13220 [Aequorivita sp.]|nr:hypothetical protein [Aequorivita sp.]|tara:strand:- start:336 stop:722 length:387 start_codon:yes stop_codon:yes gene_type:complete
MDRKIPKKYVKGLNPEQKKKQIKSIKEGKDRPKFKNVKTKRSSHVKKFEKKYGFKITDPRVTKDIITPTGKKLIVKKGYGAYYNRRSGGSRPNVSAQQWAMARLSSALTGGKAAKVDKKILDEHLIKK